MAVNIGPKIGIDGEAEYRKQLTDIIQTQKTLKSEMNAMTSAWEKDSKSLKQNKETREQLTKMVENQKKRVEELKKGLSESEKATGENSRETQKWKQAVADAQTELNKLNNELKNTPNSMQVLGSMMQDTGDKIKGAGEKFMPLSAAAAAGLGAGVKLAADFDAQMSKVQAISGATAEDMVNLNAKAREMGATTKFSASEAGAAMEYMAMAGWKAADMTAGIEGIMNLAAASGEDLALTSDIVTDALTAFGMTAEDSGHFADVLAAASSNANTNVAMLGESFKYAAPVAGAMGYSAEDVSIALGLMANSGIKASQAGTSLRTALSNMANPTKKMVGVMNELGLSLTDENGEMKNLHDVMDMLRAQFSVTTDEQIALNYAMSQDPDLMGHLADGWENMADSQKKYQTEVSVGTDIIEGMTKSELKALASQELGVELTKDRILTTEEYNTLAQRLGQDTLTGLSQSEQIAAASTLFGKNAMAGMLAILNASDADYTKLTDAIYAADGAAKGMADTMQNNLNGKLTVLKSSVEEAGISLGHALIPAIESVTGVIQGAVNWFNGVDESQKGMIATAGVLVAAIGPVLVILGTLISSVGTITAAVGAAAAVLSGPVVAGFGAALGAAFPFIAVGGAVAAAAYVIYQNWDQIKAKATELANTAKTKFNEFKTAATDKFNAAKTSVEGAMNNIKTAVDGKLNSVKATTDSVLNAVRGVWESSGGTIQGLAQTTMAAAQKAFDDAYSAIDSATNGKLSAVVGTVTGIMDNIKKAFDEKMELAKKVVQDGIDYIKGIFDFDWKLPDLKLPHFSVSGEFSLNPPSIPRFNVEWYAKAMDNGMILTSPTIFGAQNGSLLGAGEAGPEVVVGASSLYGMIQGAVASAGVNYGGVSINVYPGPGQDAKEIAREVADILNVDMERERAVWA